MADSSRSAVYAVKENIYGETPATPTIDTVRNTGCTIDLTKETVTSEEITPTEEVTDYRHSVEQTGGEISGELSFGTYDDFFAAVMKNDWAVDTPVAGTDRLKIGTTRESFSIIRHFEDIAAANKPYHIYRGQEVNTMAVSADPRGITKVTFGFIGQSKEIAQTNITGATVDPPTTSRVFDSFSGSISVGGNALAEVTELSFTLERGLDTRFVIGSKQTIKPQTGRANSSGTMKLYFENEDFVEAFMNETLVDFDFDIVDRDGNAYRFYFPRILINAAGTPTQSQGAIMLDAPFQAFLDPTESTSFIIDRIAA